MHAVNNVCMNYRYKVIYDISVDIVTFDLGLSNQGQRPFKGFVNGASYDQSLHEIHIVSHIYGLSV